MKVNGTRGKSATIVHFKHKGQNLHFCNIVQRPFTVMGAEDPLQAEVVIDFEDLHEGQSLIQMLEEFHKFCKMAAGTWQPKYK